MTHIMVRSDFDNLLSYLLDRSTTDTEKKKELKKLHPVNFAKFIKWLDFQLPKALNGVLMHDSVQFIESIYNIS